jgi:pimeloyl-ACP methyl ester carboxylesterase
MRTMIAFGLCLCLAAPTLVAAQTPTPIAEAGVARIVMRDAYAVGEVPDLRVEGLTPGESVGFHLFRQMTRWVSDGAGGWKPEPTLMHGWALYTADASGVVSAASAIPSEGTSLAVGSRTLFWSARRSDDPLIADQSFAGESLTLDNDRTLAFRVSRGSQIIAEKTFGIDRTRASMTRLDVVTPGLVGAFAAPEGADRLPTVILLHGSEGGSLAKARSEAQRYAEAGFAAFAMVYFAWPYEADGLPVPASHHNIPIEELDRARAWLAERAEADVGRLGLVGNSKGGEFAMVGAATYPWVRAAVGCVPSDVVWEGYEDVFSNTEPGARPPLGEYSSWSWQGRPLPYIPTYGDKRDGFLDNTDRYDRARAQFSNEARAARIPIERTTADLFLIGGDRDRTWSSGPMVSSLANAMDAAGRGDQVETFISPTGGHYLCGDGLYPHRLWQVDDPSVFAPNLDDQGRAEAAAWEAKIAFLNRTLAAR